MMTLALDTSANLCAVALHEAGRDRIVCSIRRETPSGHAELLFALVAAALTEAGIGYGSVSRVAAVRGPGSFTGIRIALSAARGLALARGIPAIGVDAFAAHYRSAARLTGGTGPVLVALDARRGEIYAKLFSGGRNPDAGEPFVGTPEHVLAQYREQSLAQVQVCGSGAGRFGSQFGTPIHYLAAPDIDEIAQIAAVSDPAQHPPVPLYIRPADARPQARMGVTLAAGSSDRQVR